MPLKAEKTADIALILEAIGEPVTWNSRSFRALVSPPALGEELSLGGFSETGDFTIKIPTSDFRSGPVPKIGDIVGFDGGEFRINRITNHSRYPMLILVVSPKD